MERIKIALAIATFMAVGIAVYQRLSSLYTPDVSVVSDPLSSQVTPAGLLAASGWIEGRTANVKVGTRISEQIEQILVQEGGWVRKGDTLIVLDATVYAHRHRLAEAELERAEAELNRIKNGARGSEIDEARNECLALEAELEGATKNLMRLEPLPQRFAVSQQTYDEVQTRVKSLEGKVAAARNRLSSVIGPPRDDELKTAAAGVLAARSKLSLAEESLRRTHIKAPLEGRVLRINFEVGELASPDDPLPLVILSDTRSLRAIVEVDEYDALRVQVGQPAMIITDQTPKIRMRGLVAEIEPQLDRKQASSNRPGERLDAYVRRVRIALDAFMDLPLRLPVDVLIATSSPAADKEPRTEKTAAEIRTEYRK